MGGREALLATHSGTLPWVRSFACTDSLGVDEVNQPIPKPTKKLKEPKPLQRKTPLRNKKPLLPPPHIAKPLQRAPIREHVPDDQRNIWIEVKAAWFIINPPEYEGDYYQCRLCPYAVHKEEVTLDHIQPAKTHPQLRLEFDNLQPAHWVCNGLKGSMSMEQYRKAYPETVNV